MSVWHLPLVFVGNPLLRGRVVMVESSLPGINESATTSKDLSIHT